MYSVILYSIFVSLLIAIIIYMAIIIYNEKSKSRNKITQNATIEPYYKFTPQAISSDELPLTAFGSLNVSEETTEVTANFAYNLINTQLFNTLLLNGGTVTASNSLAELQTNATANGAAILFSRGTCKYQNGTGVVCRFTAVYDTGTLNNRQYVGAGTASDGFFIGYTGINFSICRRKNGTDNTVIQTAFNTDTLNGAGPSGMTIIPSNGNVYQIVFQWLGYGMITFSVEEPTTGKFIVFHTIQYANANTEVSVSNPTFPIYWENVNFNGNTTNVTLRSSSGQLATQGKRAYLGPTFSYSSSIVGAGGMCLALSNKTVYNSITNRVRIILNFISLASNTTSSIFNIYVGSGLLATPSWVDISINSVIQYNNIQDDTLVGSPVQIMSFALAKDSSDFVSLNIGQIVLSPGEQLVITNTGSSCIAVVNWLEDL